ncbi:hypothetical protein CULCOIPH002_22020 [Corynebacterium ulcerans]|nr:hypothetical protein CULCOIPH001_19860 [Corynebacterium ulcerans]GJJ37290.1 hypothetical protein CULCOIPH002_22020 [Corynebacterium ulcerans]GJJ39342.1 hypothetical protein CULCOIPH003_19730 [Corynebacterium ulcerans]GJJ41732.1 hypothetical protein CULCOIPH004_21430 [Corynebacterium ulcerans]GJJ43302.1 hypothetical protein CULCOIPH005_14910 [Corynebacterium ulcerans]
MCIAHPVNHGIVICMAFESDSLNRRTLGPTIASAVIGIAVGIVAVIGVSLVDSGPANGAANADSSVLGDPEYGSRQ